MNRFVITYKKPSEPSAHEERALLAALRTVKIVDWTPGMVLVEGDELAIAGALHSLPAWMFSPERGLSASPPHRHLTSAE